MSYSKIIYENWLVNERNLSRNKINISNLGQHLTQSNMIILTYTQTLRAIQIMDILCDIYCI